MKSEAFHMPDVLAKFLESKRDANIMSINGPEPGMLGMEDSPDIMAAAAEEDMDNTYYNTYNLAQTGNGFMTDLMDVSVNLGKNFSIDDFMQILTETQDPYWFGLEVRVPLILVYILIILMGVIGNGFICYVILSNQKLRTARNFYVANLTVSDLILSLFCMPSTLVKLLLKSWPLGEALCKITPWLQAVNVFVSTMTILAIALDRYHVIVSPNGINKDPAKKWRALSLIVIIWFVSLLVGLPLLIYSQLEATEHYHFLRYTMCMEVWPSNTTRFVYAAVIMLVQFIGPTITLVTIHWKICNFLKARIASNPNTEGEMRRAMKESERHRKNSLLLMAIAVLFAICWFPLTLLNLLADINYFFFVHHNFLLVFATAHLVAMFSACINPIVYGWFNSNFRREFLRKISRPLWSKERKEYEAEKKRLLPRVLGALGSKLAGQQIVNTKGACYNTVQTEVQPVWMPPKPLPSPPEDLSHILSPDRIREAETNRRNRLMRSQHNNPGYTADTEPSSSTCNTYD